ncbi:unnamed protein product [Protopolystoma xenopodis]|uniref:Uncharacterized protein n=1 Tax=Protopolystoma xenopodis TaxID=117903 RepID=A0A3S5FDW0_9PLAT|nr:unnamed protein product [Protopolystoma xenopodis]
MSAKSLPASPPLPPKPLLLTNHLLAGELVPLGSAGSGAFSSSSSSSSSASSSSSSSCSVLSLPLPLLPPFPSQAPTPCSLSLPLSLHPGPPLSPGNTTASTTSSSVSPTSSLVLNGSATGTVYPLLFLGGNSAGGINTGNPSGSLGPFTRNQVESHVSASIGCPLSGIEVPVLNKIEMPLGVRKSPVDALEVRSEVSCLMETLIFGIVIGSLIDYAAN